MDLIDTGHRQISRKLDLLRLKVLATVMDHAPVRPGMIASELTMSASAVSRHLAALEDAGHIELTVDPADARSFLITPTPAGVEARQAAISAGSRAFTSVISGWTDEEVQAALTSVRRLNATWAAHHANRPPDIASRRSGRQANRRKSE